VSALGPIVPFILILAVFWLLILRPQQRRQRELRALQSTLTTGSDVMLTSGIFGTVTSTNDDHVLVEIAPGVTIKVVRGAVAQQLDTTETDRGLSDGGEPDGAEPAGSEEN
jgi:preprotein translocase subunit YajC